MITKAQVVEMSVIVTNNSPFQDYPHLDDHTTWSKVYFILHPVLLIFWKNFYANFYVQFLIQCLRYWQSRNLLLATEEIIAALLCCYFYSTYAPMFQVAESETLVL